MSNKMELQLLLKLNDQMSRGLKSAMNSVQKETKGVTSEVNNLAKAANNLKPTGIARLTSELNKAKSAAKSTMEMLQKTAQIGAAVAAGGYVLKTAAAKPMAFDRKLALMANTAYSDQGVTGRIAGKAALEAAIRNAQKQGLGNQDDVADTLNMLIGSGAMGSGKAGLKSSMDLLPSLAKAASGTGAEATDLAKLAIAAKQNMGLSDAETKAFLSKAITAGNEGGFDLKDMAKYLPAQMALYSANGMKGMRGAEDLLAYNQVARITAGNSDEAGNNMVNLLGKINSSDTQNDFKKQGIDLTGSLAQARGKGMSTLDAFMALVDRVASKDKSYRALEAKSKNQSGDDKKATLSAMMDIIEQKGIGLTVQDRQAMSALLGAKQNKAKLNDVRNKVMADQGGQVDANYATVRNTSSGAAEALANVKDAAASGALANVDGPLQKVLNYTSSLAAKFPTLATGVYEFGTAISAAAVGLGAFSFLGKGAATGAGSATAKAAARFGTATPWLGSLAMGAAPLGVMAGVTNWIDKNAGRPDAADPFLKLSATLNTLLGIQKQSYADAMAKQRAELIDLSARPVNVTVDVKNGNIVAAVNAENARIATRK